MNEFNYTGWIKGGASGGGGSVEVDAELSTTSENPVQNKVITTALNDKAILNHKHVKADITDFPTLATVATSGSYTDLINKPSIPAAITVDAELSTTSENPVQNKVIAAKLNEIASSLDSALALANSI